MNEDTRSLPGERLHGQVGVQHVADDALRAETSCPALQVGHQQHADALVAKIIGDRERELEIAAIRGECIARLADHPRPAFDAGFGDHRHLPAAVEMGHAVELGRRQFAQRTEEAVVAGFRRKRAARCS